MKHPSPIKVMVADDHPPIRLGIRALLDKIPGVECVGEAPDGKQLLKLIETSAVDLILLDIKMPILNGIEALKSIRQNYPSIKVIMLTNYLKGKYLTNSIQLGALGYLYKDLDAKELSKAIEKVMRGERYVSGEASQTLVDDIHAFRPGQQQPFYLTPKEKEVMQLLVADKRTDQIAEALGCANSTVIRHRKNILGKSRDALGIETLPGLIAYLVENGMLAD